MATMTYTPIGHQGYSCRVTSAGGRTLLITREDPGSEPTVSDESSDALASNDSLQRQLRAYGESEFASRRARNAARKKALRKAAEEHEEVVFDLADLIDLVGHESRTAWCSGCLEKHPQWHVSRRALTPDAWICSGCGAATTPCLWPGCKHYSLRKPKIVQLGKWCAEHRHDIPGFEKLDARLTSLDQYDTWLDFDSVHAKRIATMTTALVGGAIVVAPLALLAAPAIGGAIGAWGTGLSGAAASSHGLALLGGGSLAAGGFGMFGGTVVVTAAGAGLGGQLGASIASSYVGDDSSFKIDTLEKGGGGPPVVFSSGFLTEGAEGWGEWEKLIRQRYPNSPVYRLHWGATEQKDLRALFGVEAGAILAAGGLIQAAGKAVRLAFKKVGAVSSVTPIAAAAKNPWTVARTRAHMTAAVLADLIARTASRDYVLIGHSLGARVMLATAEALGAGMDEPRVQELHLLGAAVNAKHDLTGVGRGVAGTIWNYWSKNDWVLRSAYPSAQLGEKAAGAVGLLTPHAKVKNRNVSATVKGHSGYVPAVKLQ